MKKDKTKLSYTQLILDKAIEKLKAFELTQGSPEFLAGFVVAKDQIIKILEDQKYE